MIGQTLVGRSIATLQRHRNRHRINIPHLQKRTNSGMISLESLADSKTDALVYSEHGAVVNEMLKMKQVPVWHRNDGKGLSELDHAVHIKMLAAPINPADINQIQGVYAHLPPLPAVGGNEGVGEVLHVGKSVVGLKAGDWVVPATGGLGTWRRELVCPARHVTAISRKLPVEAAASILVNPCTAYRMLADFVDLKPGDVIIQNGANSAVGLAVIQLSKARGIRTINLLRDRPNYELLEKKLLEYGATMVVKAERLPLDETQQHIIKVLGQRPILGLNCVGGQAATDMARTLQDGAILVTYGAMSKKPVTVPNALLIFKDIQIRGFWVSAWYRRQMQSEALGDHSLTEKRHQMMSDLTEMIINGKLAMPTFRKHHLDAYQDAFTAATASYTDCKELFIFDN